MSQAFRLPEGGLINRGKRLTFTWDGKSFDGFEGDTLASALLANGVHFVARSFKYHRPRGILAAGIEEPNAMVQLGHGGRSDPNPRATVVPLVNGLEARPVNVSPSLEFDVSSVFGLGSRLMPAGFYYKVMHESQKLWQKVYEPLIRKAAGWGKAPTEADPDTYDHRHVHCDVLVVGGGPAGLAAARAAGRTGARVILCDEQERFGGSLLGAPRTIGDKSGDKWADDVTAELAEMEEVRLLPRTMVFGYYDHNYLVALERRTDHLSAPAAGTTRQRVWHIRAERVILATGAHERPLVFADNDRPGVMLADAVRTYVHRYAVLPGRRAVVFTNNDGAYETALLLKKAGAEVAAIVDTRGAPNGPLVAAAQAAGIEVLPGHAVVGTRGSRRVSGVEVRRMTADRSGTTGDPRRIDCDLVATSGGWSPVVHLFSQSRGKLRFDEEWACFRPGESVQAERSVGAANGTFTLLDSLREGAEAGAEAARLTGFTKRAAPAIKEVDEPVAGPPEPLWLVPGAEPVGKSSRKWFVDFQNDSTASDILLAVREGFESIEHVKRYTLTGFGTDQGKTGNINAMGIVAGALGRPVREVGTTTFRAPYSPVTFGAMAGRNRGDRLEPQRLTAMHDWHVRHGAKFEDVGQWKRPWYFPKPGEDMHAAVARECRAARESVGVLDASTLGKIDIQGPDAGEFLNRVYTNAWAKLGLGRIRYGIMCREDGMVFDDGTTARIGENRWLMTTTTGNAARVMDHLEEYLQTEWPDLRVRLTSVTEQWATAAVAGPKAHEVVKRLCPDEDLSPETFPFMSWKPVTVAGIKGRIFRISFTGELQYEINVPWHDGLKMWEAVMAAGADFDITPYGTETMHVLRAEKGFIIVGQETDGTQTPGDLGLDWLVSDKKPDFIGKRSLTRPDMLRDNRKQLVGLMPVDGSIHIPEGTQLVEKGRASAAPPVPMLGFVTSSYWSPALGSNFALALVEGGRARQGEIIEAALPNGGVPVKLTDTVFYDREGKRRDG